MPATPIVNKTPVAILSRSRLFRETCAAWLRLQREISTVAVAGSMHQLLKRLDGCAAPVLLAHGRFDGLLGAEIAWDVKTLLPAAHLVVLGDHRSDAELARWIDAGAMAYLEHDASPGELLQTICEVVRGCPRCSLASVTRVIGRRGQEACKAGRSGGRPAAELLGDHQLDAAIRRAAGLPDDTYYPIRSGRDHGDSACETAALFVDNLF